MPTTSIDPLHKAGFNDSDKRRGRGMLRPKQYLQFDPFNFVFFHIFRKLNFRVKGTKREIPNVKVIQFWKVESPVSFIAEGRRGLCFDDLP